jgi:hypothetical protein
VTACVIFFSRVEDEMPGRGGKGESAALLGTTPSSKLAPPFHPPTALDRRSQLGSFPSPRTPYGGVDGIATPPSRRKPSLIDQFRSKLGWTPDRFVTTAPPEPVQPKEEAVSAAAVAPAAPVLPAAPPSRMAVDIAKYKQSAATPTEPVSASALVVRAPIASAPPTLKDNAAGGESSDDSDDDDDGSGGGDNGEVFPKKEMKKADSVPVKKAEVEKVESSSEADDDDADDDDDDSDDDGQFGFGDEPTPSSAAGADPDGDAPIFETNDDSVFGSSAPAGRTPRGKMSIEEKKRERAERRAAQEREERAAAEKERRALEAEEARLEVQKFFASEKTRKEQQELAARQQAEIQVLRGRAASTAAGSVDGASGPSSGADTERAPRSKSVERPVGVRSRSSSRDGRSSSRGADNNGSSSSAAGRPRSNSSAAGSHERSSSLTRSNSASSLSRAGSRGHRRTGSTGSGGGSAMDLRHTSITSLDRAHDAGWTCPGCGR